MVGRADAPERDARTRCLGAPPGRGRCPRTRDTLGSMPRFLHLSALVVAVLVAVACSATGQAASFDPGGPCTTDGRAPGAYPELEALVPQKFLDAAPERLDSGRNCTAANLGSLTQRGINEVRFAGGTWTFGAERAAVLAVFRTAGLDADSLAAFYAQSAQAAPRTSVVAQSAPLIEGRAGHRIDTKTGERLQTVVTWPGVAANTVNVVITNDLPDARIQDAIAAYEGR